MTYFIDTNYFLRFLLKDHSEQQNRVAELFEELLEEKAKAFTSLIVIFEVYWVLSSFYKQVRESISTLLRNILILDFIDLAEKEILLQAIDLYEKTNLDLEDCYNLFYAKQEGEKVQFASFDKEALKQFEKI